MTIFNTFVFGIGSIIVYLLIGKIIELLEKKRKKGE